MSTRFVKWNSAIATQPIASDIIVPPIGELPTSERGSATPPPEVVVQGNSFFSLDSIGSSRFETRNFDITHIGPTITLPTCSAESPAQAGLSPRRPSLIGIVDPFGSSISQRAASANFTASLSASLDFTEFEARLAIDDYQYLVNSVRNNNLTSAVYASLENQVATDIAAMQAPIDNMARLATSIEKFAEDLDVKFSWSSLRDDIIANYDSFFKESDFKPSAAYTAILDLYGSENSSSTTILQSIYRDLQYSTIDQFENILESQGLLFDDGNIEGYSDKSKIEKVALCCKFLANIFNNSIVGNLPIAVLPVTYSGGFVFESRKPGARALSNYEAIVAPMLKSMSTQPVESFKTSFVSSFSSTIALAERRNTSVKSIDIFIAIMRSFVESFPTLQIGGDLNGDEITDGVSLLLSLKTPFSNAEFNGLIRGSLLTMLLDQDVDTLRFSNALNLTLVGNSSIYQTRSFRVFPDEFLTAERLKNFPRSSRQYVNSIVAGDLPSQFDPVIGSGIQQGTVKGNWQTNAPKNFDSEIQRSNDRRIARGLPQGYDIASYKIAGTGSVISQILANSIDGFSRGTKITVAKSIELVYDKLSGIARNFGISLNDLRLSSGNTLTQRMIYSIILECIANITAIFLRPGYSSGIEEVSRSNQIITELEKKLQELQEDLRLRKARLESNLERLRVIADNVERGESDAEEEDREIRRENRELRRKIDELEFEISAVNSQIAQSSILKRFYFVVDPTFRDALKFVNDVINSRSSTSLALVFENSLRNLSDDAYRVPPDVRSGISNIANVNRKALSKLAALKAVSQKLSNSTAELIASFNLAETSTRSFGSKRDQIFSSLTSETASQLLLILNSEIQKGPLSQQSRQAIYDVVSTRKLMNLLTIEASSRKSAIAIVGMPSGFMQNIRTQPTDAANSARPAYYSIELTGRSLTYPYLNGVTGPKFNFHPFISCRFANDQIPTIDGVGTIYSCFSTARSRWVDVEYNECVSFIMRGAAFEGEPSTTITTEPIAKSIVESHFYDAICKSCIRTVMGIDFGNLSTRPLMSQNRANLAVSLISNSPSDLFPRRGLQAAEFLSLQRDGNILPVAFSELSGTSSDKTTPADHSVLLDFLSSGIFTSSTLQDRILTVGNFERIHCAIFDPNSFTYINEFGEEIDSEDHAEFLERAGIAADSLISNCSILGIRIGAQY